MKPHESSGDGLDNTEIESRKESEGLESQIVLILVGLPGSSKSTLSTALVSHSHSSTWSFPSRGVPGDRPGGDLLRDNGAKTSIPSSGESSVGQGVGRIWTRVSQDESPNKRRQECEAALREALQRGENVVVDRVNFDPIQRAHFVNIAETFTPRPLIWALILQVSEQTLRRRLENRPWHPTIPDAETGYRVLNQMKGTFSPPKYDQPEGFDRVFTLQERDQPINGQWSEFNLIRLLEDISRRGEKEVGERKPVQRMIGYAATGGYRGYRGGYEGYRGNGYRGRGDYGYAGGSRRDWRGGSSHTRGIGYPRQSNGVLEQPDHPTAYRSRQYTGNQTTQGVLTGLPSPAQGYRAEGYPTYHLRPTQYGASQIRPPYNGPVRPASNVWGAP